MKFSCSNEAIYPFYTFIEIKGINSEQQEYDFEDSLI